MGGIQARPAVCPAAGAGGVPQPGAGGLHRPADSEVTLSHAPCLLLPSFFARPHKLFSELLF